MKRRYVTLVIGVCCTCTLCAQDPVLFANFSNTQIVTQDSVVMISTFGQPFGGIYQQNDLIIILEPFPFLLLSGTTAIHDVPAISDLKVYPNPAHDIAVMQRTESNEVYQVALFDGDGRTIHESSWQIDAETMQITLGDRASGVYILIVTDEKRSKASQFKIVKQ